MNENQIGGQLALVIYILIFAAIYYFLLYLPQKRRAQERRELMNNLKVNNEIITTGGIIGTVKGISDDIIMLEVDKDVTIRLSRDAVVAIIPKTESVGAA